jgi:hypothetical protein
MRIRLLLPLLFYLSALFAQEPKVGPLPDGVRIPITVIQDLRLPHLKVGDKVRFRVTANLLGPNKQVVVPKDAIAIATVSDLQRISKDHPSRLCLLFEEIIWKGGSLRMRAFADGPLLQPQNAALRASGWYTLEAGKGREFSPFGIDGLGIESKAENCPAIINTNENVGLFAGTKLFIKQLSLVPDKIKITLVR